MKKKEKKVKKWDTQTGRNGRLKLKERKIGQKKKNEIIGQVR